MSFSKHNNFELPDGGVQNWDASLNENFDLIEKGPTIKAIAGLTIAIDKVVHMNNSERLYLGISPTGSTTASEFLGFTTTVIDQEVEGYVRISGNHSGANWSFTPGPVYLSDTTAGDITQTEPSVSTMVGYAIGTNELIIKPWIDNSFDHGTLSGLVDPADDHTQYLATDNRRSTSGLTITGPLSINNITPESNPYVTIQAGLTITGSTLISTGQFDAQTTQKLIQNDQDEAFLDLVGLAVTGGTSSIDLNTDELGAVYAKARVRVNGVTKWIRLYDDET